MRARLTLILLSLVLLFASSVVVGCATYSNSRAGQWRALLSKEKAAAKRAWKERDAGLDAVRLGNAEKALPHFEKACRIYEKTFGPEHYYMSQNCYDDLCYVHYGMSDYEKAREYCAQGMALSEKIEPKNTGQLAIYENRLGNIDAGRHQWEAALAHYKKSAALFQKSNRPDHNWEVGVNVRACSTANYLKRPAEALPYCEQALKLAHERSGFRDKDRARALMQKGLALNNLDRHDEAIPVLEEAVADGKRVLGVRDNELQTAQVVLATIYSHSGSYERGEALYLEILSNRETHDYRWSSQLGYIYNELALNYLRQERGPEAVKAAENAVLFRVADPDLSDEDWRETVNNLVAAKSLAGWGDETEAELRERLDAEHIEKAEESRKRLEAKEKKKGKPKSAEETTATPVAP